MSAHFDWLIAAVIRSPSSQPRVVYISSEKTIEETLYAMVYAVHMCVAVCGGIKYNKNHKKNEENIEN